MRGKVVLRGCMLGLVLVNLVFVQLTEATSLSWLLPLYALTLLAPLLAPLREKLAYQLLWNAGVLSVFALLVGHASGYDLRFVLEDGLVLAALCQVHLLNNLRSDQRPDLLFWNSFLIAVATGYLSQDLVYPFAFLIYVPLYVIGLQLLCVTRRSADLDPEPTRRIVRDGFARSGVLLVFTLAVFLFWPRDFHRPSLLSGEFDFNPTSESLEIAFTDRLSLDQKGRAKASNRVVMTATLLQGSASNIPTLWRGATLASTDGNNWWPIADRDFAKGESGDEPWFRHRDQLFRSRDKASGALLQIENVDGEANRLFAPLSAERIDLGEGAEVGRVVALPDGTLQYGKPKLVRPPLNYELVLDSSDPPRLGGPTPDALERGLSRYTALPSSLRVRPAVQLAETLGSRMPRAVTQSELVSSFSDYLETRYTYLAPGADGAAENLAEFLAGEKGAHCEYFASALATMLRSRGVPCRVVTGYRSSEWDVDRRVLTFRRRHAHAWVEVYDPTGGWYSVDPNPAVSHQSGPSLWEQAHAALGQAWGVLAGFDAKSRDEVLAWVQALPGRVVRGAVERPEIAALIVVGAAGLFVVVRRIRRRGTLLSVRIYRSALRRAGVRLDDGETPRELLERARDAGVDERKLALLTAATREHEHARYAA